MRTIFPLMAAALAVMVANLTGTHMCPDELNTFLQVWVVMGQGAMEHMPLFFHLPRWGTRLQEMM